VVPAQVLDENGQILNFNGGVDEGFGEDEADVPLLPEDDPGQGQAELVPVLPAVEDAAEPGGFGFVLGGGLGAAHQALLLRDSPTEFHPYRRPRWFHFKVCDVEE